MKKWWTDPKDFDKLSFCVYAAEIRGEEERPYVLIPAAQWEELERLVREQNKREWPCDANAIGRMLATYIDKLHKLIDQIGGAEDEGK